MKILDYLRLDYFLNKLKLIFLPRPATGNDGEFLVKVGDKTEWRALPNLLLFRGIVPTFNDLPSAATASVGDVWAVIDQDGAEYYCSIDDYQVKFWDALGVHLGQYVEGDGIDIDIINHIIAVKYQGALEVDANGVLYVNPAKVVGEGQNISISQTSGILGTPSTISALGYKWDSSLKSFAEGPSIIEGNSVNSHTESLGYIVGCDEAHAEGLHTSVERLYSTSGVSIVNGNHGHAEGAHTLAVGNAHAEGESTAAEAYSAHAEGNHTRAVGTGSHAEGGHSIAKGTFSHAEGGSNNGIEISNFTYRIISFGPTPYYGQFEFITGTKLDTANILHIILWNSVASIVDVLILEITESEDEVDNNTVYTYTVTPSYVGVSYYLTDGNRQHRLPPAVAKIFVHYTSTQAIGDSSHAEGTNTLAYGYSAHAEGLGTIAGNDYLDHMGPIANATFTAHGNNILLMSGTPSINLKVGDTVAFYNSSGDIQVHIITRIDNPEFHVLPNFRDSSPTVANGQLYYVQYAAMGIGSHTEGIGTVAVGDGQHVEGTYNYPIVDAKSIIGIGDGKSSSISPRENAVVVLNNGDIYIKGLGTYLGQGITSATTLLSFLNTLSATVAELNALHPIYTISVSSAASGYDGALVDNHLHVPITSGRYTLKIVGYLAIGPDHEDPSDTGNYTVTYEINDDATQSVEVSSHFGAIVFPMPYKNTTITILSVTPIS